MADAQIISLRPTLTDDATPHLTGSRRLVHAWREAVWSSNLPATDKLVALTYADHTGDGALRVWVAPERLQERTSLGRTATTAAVRRLREAGWLSTTTKGHRGAVTRYALTVPDGAAEQRPDSGIRNPEPSRLVSPPDTSPRGQVSAPDERVSPRDGQGSADGPDPLLDPLPHPTNQDPTPVVDVAEARDEVLAGMVGAIYSAKIAVGLTATAAQTHAVALAAAGWTAEALRRELDAQDWTGARSPGLLRHRLTTLAATGPARPVPAAPRDTATQDRLRADQAHAAAVPVTPDTLAAIKALAASAAATARTRVAAGLRAAA